MAQMATLDTVSQDGMVLLQPRVTEKAAVKIRMHATHRGITQGALISEWAEGLPDSISLGESLARDVEPSRNSR